MSTLTTSPSPAASPRASFFAVPQRTSRSPRHPPHSSPLTRPNAQTSPSKHTPKQSPLIQSHRTTYSPATKSQTADAGTQYTPEGLPPTARKDSSDRPAAGNKRKEAPPSPSMNTLTKTPAQPPPPEPEPRKTPAQNATKVTPAQLQGDPESPSATKRQRTADRSVKSMPIQYENCNPKDLGILIANMLMELIRLNDPIPLRDGRLTRFHSR